MDKRVLGIAAVVLFAGGISIGNITDPDPETVVNTKIIKVPVTHEVTKTVEVEPSTPPTSIPESCYKILDFLDNQDRITQKVSKSTGDVMLGLDNLGKKVYEDSVPAVNRLIAYLNLQSDQQRTYILDLTANSNEVRDQFEACKVVLNDAE